MEIGAAGAAAAAAAAAGGTGVGLFSYNRGNYQFDAKMRYTRFTAGLNMAIAQTGIYRQDIQQLSMLTVTRMDCYHCIAAMGLTILTAIYCPGRLGLHTPPPPGWLMGLTFVNIAGCYLFLGLAIWLAMHASMRADTASTHMLTRFVRLPVPSQGMLDKARKFLSSFEEQPLREAFRIPFTRHGKPGGASRGGYNEDMSIESEAKGRTRSNYDVPAWYRRERAVDCKKNVDTVTSMMPLAAKGTAPEHFEAYRELQMEWFPYDVYARLCIHLAFTHLVFCWAYLQIGHQLQETRALWACAIVMFPMFTLMQVIMSLDIAQTGFPFHRLCPFALFIAYIAAVLEYTRYYSPVAQGIGFALVYVAYFLHVVYTVQMYFLCRPAVDPPNVAEVPGASWWPSEWRLPKAFQHAIWLVAPPRDADPSQPDLVGEMRQLQGEASQCSGKVTQPSDAEKRADAAKALSNENESPAWLNVRIGLISMLIAWIWLIFGFTIEVINQGTTHPSLLNAFGLPNNARDPRYRPAKPGLHEPTEVGTGGLDAGPARGVDLGAMHRRLASAAENPEVRQDVAEKLRVVMRAAQAAAGATTATTATTPAVPRQEDGQPAQTVSVRWQPLFEPELLVARSGGSEVVAFSRYGRGALLSVPAAGASGSSAAVEAAPFALDGVVAHGALASAHWDEDGLLLLTASGALLECAGEAPNAGGAWSCSRIEGAKLEVPHGASVAVTRSGPSSAAAVKAAVSFHGEGTAALFEFRSAAWLPVGEVRTGVTTAGASAFGPGGLVVAGAGGGAVARVDMDSGGVAPAAPKVQGEVRGVCALGDGRVGRVVRVGGQAGKKELVIH